MELIVKKTKKSSKKSAYKYIVQLVAKWNFNGLEGKRVLFSHSDKPMKAGHKITCTAIDTWQSKDGFVWLTGVR